MPKHSVAKRSLLCLLAAVPLFILIVIWLLYGSCTLGLRGQNVLHPRLTITSGGHWTVTVTSDGQLSYAINSLDEVSEETLYRGQLSDRSASIIVGSLRTMMKESLAHGDDYSTAHMYSISIGDESRLMTGRQLFDNPRYSIHWKAIVDAIGLDPEAPVNGLGYLSYPEYGLINEYRKRPSLLSLSFDPNLGIWSMVVFQGRKKFLFEMTRNGGFISLNPLDETIIDEVDAP